MQRIKVWSKKVRLPNLQLGQADWDAVHHGLVAEGGNKDKVELIMPLHPHLGRISICNICIVIKMDGLLDDDDNDYDDDMHGSMHLHHVGNLSK